MYVYMEFRGGKRQGGWLICICLLFNWVGKGRGVGVGGGVGGNGEGERGSMHCQMTTAFIGLDVFLNIRFDF